MRGEFAATIPCQGLHEPVGQPSDTPGDGTRDRVCVLTRQSHEHHVARLTFDERRDVRASSSFKEIAFPMTRHSAILDFCWSLSNGNGVENLPLSRVEPSAGARMSKVVLTAQVFEETAPQDPTTLHE